MKMAIGSRIANGYQNLKARLAQLVARPQPQLATVKGKPILRRTFLAVTLAAGASAFIPGCKADVKDLSTSKQLENEGRNIRDKIDEVCGKRQAQPVSKAPKCDTAPKYAFSVPNGPLFCKPIKISGNRAESLTDQNLGVSIFKAQNDKQCKVSLVPSQSLPANIKISLGDKITVSNLKIASDGKLTANITIESNFPKGKTVRDMQVTIDGKTKTTKDAITIIKWSRRGRPGRPTDTGGLEGL